MTGMKIGLVLSYNRPGRRWSPRLCDQAKSGGILISEAVYAAADDFVAVGPAGDYVLKGFPNPVTALRVAGLRD